MTYQVESLTEREIESLLNIMDSSFRVSDRLDYDLWTRTGLGRLFSHQIMVSMAKRGTDKAVVHVEKSAEIPLSRAQIADIFCGEGGLMGHVMKFWRTCKRPYLENEDGHDTEEMEAASSMIQTYGLGNVAAHGVEDLGSNVTTFFCFAYIPVRLVLHHAYLLEMIVPHLNVVFTRACAGQPTRSAPHNDRHAQLTVREKEIMGWVKEGKSNWEIAMILDISELTVKNHLHNILRKLSAQSRGHAVAKAIRLNLI